MLGEDSLRRLIETGELGVEPFTMDSLGPCSLDLRLGTQFFLDSEQSDTPTKALGDPAIVEPTTRCVFTTLETISMPQDVSGVVLPTSRFARQGLILSTSSIFPGFRGKLVMSAWNMSPGPVTLHSGQRFALINFFPVQGIKTYPITHVYEQNDEAVRDIFANLKVRLEPPNRPLLHAFKVLVDGAKGKELSQQEKGRALEEIAQRALEFLRGLRVIKKNARLSAEEIDLLVENTVESLLWQSLGTPILVECKNWSRPVGTPEITNLIGKMEALGPHARTGILVAVNGISGDTYRDAQLRRREARQKGRNVLVLTWTDLDSLADGTGLHEVIQRSYDELLLI